jgi:uncharacterized protein
MKSKSFPLPLYALLLLGISISNPIQAQGLLWKITGNTLQSPAWIYGTMHVQDARVFQLPEGWEQKMEKAGKLALELDLNSVPDPTRIMALLQSPEDSALDKLLDADAYARLSKWFQDSLGMSIEPFKGMKPFMLMSMVQKSRMSADMPMALDAWLGNRAREANIPVVGIETIEEQMGIIDRLSISEQARMLVEFVNQNEDRQAQEAELMEAYLNGRLDRLMHLAAQWEADPQFKHEIITVRNRIMAVRITEMLEQESAFIAIGALHLPGKEGVIELLRQRGFTVEPEL